MRKAYGIGPVLVVLPRIPGRHQISHALPSIAPSSIFLSGSRGVGVGVWWWFPMCNPTRNCPKVVFCARAGENESDMDGQCIRQHKLTDYMRVRENGHDIDYTFTLLCRYFAPYAKAYTCSHLKGRLLLGGGGRNMAISNF